MKYFVILFTLMRLLLFEEALHAQSYFDDFLKDQGLNFKKPEGYTLKIIGDQDENEFECHCYTTDSREDLVSGDFYLYNSDKSVIIMIEDDGYSDLKGALVPYWYDDNLNSIRFQRRFQVFQIVMFNGHRLGIYTYPRVHSCVASTPDKVHTM